MVKKSLLKRIGESLKGSPLTAASDAAVKRKGVVLLTMLLDLLFLASLFVLNKVLTAIFPDPASLLLGAGSKIGLGLLLMFVYICFIIMAYSFFKFVVLKVVSLIFRKRIEGFSMFDTFLFSNLLLLGSFFLITLFVSLLSITTIRIEALAAVRDIVLILIGSAAYLVTNTSHSLFAQGAGKAGKIVRGGFDLVFGSFRKFIPLIIFTVAAFFVLSGIYYLFDWVILKILGTAISVPAVYLSYAAINTFIIFIFGFGLLAFNRIYFYELVSRIRPKSP